MKRKEKSQERRKEERFGDEREKEKEERYGGKSEVLSQKSQKYGPPLSMLIT